jgi:hypothetical protein
MLRRLVGLRVVGVAVTVAAVTAVGAAPAGAAAVGGCQLEGTASFSPGLSNTPQPFTYSFAGDLSGCQSSDGSTPAGGTVEAGKTITRLVTNTITGETHNVTYQAPLPTGDGGCASSTTSGIAVVNWADGTRTIVDYSTAGVLAAVQLSGTVVPSVTLNAIDAQPGDPTTQTLTTSRYDGYDAGGVLEFQPPDPTACTGAGVTAAGISGVIGLGSGS